MSASHLADEMREAEEEIDEDTTIHDPSNPGGVALEHLEEGRPSRPGPLENGLSGSRTESPGPAGRSAGRNGGRLSISLGAGAGPLKAADLFARIRESTRNAIQLMTSPVFAQAFILTFLGEWGDRSQITTIAMAGAHVSLLILPVSCFSADTFQSIPVIAVGTIVGHSLCTFLAVMGGRYLSTKLSIKHSESSYISIFKTRHVDTSSFPPWRVRILHLCDHVCRRGIQPPRRAPSRALVQ